jgi:hypothetical protein
MPKSTLGACGEPTEGGHRCGDTIEVPIHRERMGLYELCHAGYADHWQWWIELGDRRICGGERSSKKNAQRAARSMMTWIAQGRRV